MLGDGSGLGEVNEGKGDICNSFNNKEFLKLKIKENLFKSGIFSLFPLSDSDLLDYKHFCFVYIWSCQKLRLDYKTNNIFIVYSSNIKIHGHQKEASRGHLFSYMC